MKNKYKIQLKLILLAIVFFTPFLASCATRHPPMTREEYINNSTRIYKNSSPEQIYEAAKTVFLLSDGNDFTFSYTEDTMRASNNWLVYIIISSMNGSDEWLLETEETDRGMKAKVQVSTTSQATHASAMGPYTTNHTRGQTPRGPAIFKLFWYRMDYLLGKKDDWISCAEMNEIKKENEGIWGGTPQLCRVGSLSLNPDEVYAWASEENKKNQRFTRRKRANIEHPVAKSSWKKVDDGYKEGLSIYKVPASYLLEKNGIHF